MKQDYSTIASSMHFYDHRVVYDIICRDDVQEFSALAKAVILYNPATLCEHLRRDDNGVVYVDKFAAIGTTDSRSEAAGLFRHIFSISYSWGWDNWENATMYFEVDGDRILGGAYYLDTKVKKSQRVAGRRFGSGNFGYYSQYKNDEYEEICEKIRNI